MADDDEFMTRREAELALDSEHREQAQHNAAHETAHEAHEAKHRAEAAAVETALTAVGRERDIHAGAHDKAHAAHDKEHQLNDLAITKAEQASEIRFTSVNEFRGQMGDLIRTLASKDQVDALIKDSERRWEEIRKEMDRRYADQSRLTQERYEANRASIINLEKGDVKAEGKGIGQGTVIAAIVTSISVVGAILGILIVIANFATKAT